METVETAKKLLIREGAMRAYREGTIENVVKETMLEVENLITVSQMTKSEIGTLIGNLEKARLLLSSLTQGLQIAHANEVEPEFKAKHEKERKEARAKQPKTLEGSLAALGIDLADVVSALSKKNPSQTSNKIKCDKCQIEFWPAMKDMHKC